MGVQEKLRALMKVSGLNASQLAEKANLPKSTVYAILKRDSSNLSYGTSCKLAEALNCSPAEFCPMGHQLEKDFKSRKKQYLLEIQKKQVKLSTLSRNEKYSKTAKKRAEILRDEINRLEFKIKILNEHFGVFLTQETNDVLIQPIMFQELLNPYVDLNEAGRHEAEKRVEELTHIEKYTKKDKD